MDRLVDLEVRIDEKDGDQLFVIKRMAEMCFSSELKSVWEQFKKDMDCFINNLEAKK